jgi:hypothetical protein
MMQKEINMTDTMRERMLSYETGVVKKLNFYKKIK